MMTHYGEAGKSFYPSTYTYTHLQTTYDERLEHSEQPSFCLPILVLAWCAQTGYDNALCAHLNATAYEENYKHLSPPSILEHIETDFSFISITVNICRTWLTERVFQRLLHCGLPAARIQDYKCGGRNPQRVGCDYSKNIIAPISDPLKQAERDGIRRSTEAVEVWLIQVNRGVNRKWVRVLAKISRTVIFKEMFNGNS